jgi:hypothetical protein
MPPQYSLDDQERSPFELPSRNPDTRIHDDDQAVFLLLLKFSLRI